MNYLTETIIEELYSKFFEITENLGINGAEIEKKDIIVHNNKIIAPFYYNAKKSNSKYSNRTELTEDNVYFLGEKNAIEDLNAMFHLKMKSYPVLFEPQDVLENKYENKQTKPLEEKIKSDNTKFINELKIKLENSKSENIINSKKAKEKFAELGELQRGHPEIKMLECQMALSGGVLPSLLEHIGDLTHRMSEEVFSYDGNIEGTINQVLPKVNKGISYLTSGYGFEREHNENMESNYKFKKERGKINVSFAEWKEGVEKLIEEYAKEHEKLPVYNDAQYAAREAAIGLGKMDFDYSLKQLQYLKDIIDNNQYIEIASQFDENYEKPKKQNKIKNKP